MLNPALFIRRIPVTLLSSVYICTFLFIVAMFFFHSNIKNLHSQATFKVFFSSSSMRIFPSLAIHSLAVSSSRESHYMCDVFIGNLTNTNHFIAHDFSLKFVSGYISRQRERSTLLEIESENGILRSFYVENLHLEEFKKFKNVRKT